MDPRIETVTRNWQFRSTDPGYAGLHALADAGFSGTVAADGAQGFMVNGRLIGIADGTIEAFWSSDLSAMEAPDPSLPLLCAMLTRQSAVEGEYYTGETAIADVDDTLSSGSFTGYIELSENVFSGDYFVLYYGGTARPVAILGTEDRVVTGAEAFERASEEVGIYRVKSVSIDVIDIPEPEVDESSNDVEEPASDPELDEEVEDPVSSASVDEPATVQRPPPTASEPEREQPSEPSEQQEPESGLAALAEAAMGESAATIAKNASQVDPVAPDEWVTIPALDPERTTIVEPPEPEPTESAADTDVTEPSESNSPSTDTADAGDEASELTETLAELEAENDRLRDRVNELESELAALQEPDSIGTDIDPAVAISGTNLFVRYDSKADHTLSDAAAGSGAHDRVRSNLAIEWHTNFDADEATIDGEPFTSFLQARTEYRFVQWILEELLFELRDTGQQSGFEALYEAIPEIDRIEFDGRIPVHSTGDGERRSETYEFDIVFRNGMGEPLLVADVHGGRAAADGDTVGELLQDANAVAAERSNLNGALFVTSSYFDPEALETVANATGGGFLRGNSRESYVSVSRKNGFHLCLVEARNGSFHLNVPDS